MKIFFSANAGQCLPAPRPSVLSVVSFLALSFCLVSLAHAVNIYVDDDTCPGTGSGTQADPYCSIATAIASAASGDDVLVYPGTYAERIIMRTGVDVRRATTEKPVIRPTRKTLVKFYNVDNATLDGFVLDASGNWGMPYVAIVRVFYTCTNVTISNCDLIGAPTPGTGSYVAGIRVDNQVDLRIIGNTIRNVDWGGIAIGYDSTNGICNSTITIRGNTIEGNGAAGIRLAGESGCTNQVIIGGSGASDGNLITGNPGELFADPLFVDRAGGDYRLQAA